MREIWEKRNLIWIKFFSARSRKEWFVFPPLISLYYDILIATIIIKTNLKKIWKQNKLCWTDTLKRREATRLMTPAVQMRTLSMHHQSKRSCMSLRCRGHELRTLNLPYSSELLSSMLKRILHPIKFSKKFERIWIGSLALFCLTQSLTVTTKVSFPYHWILSTRQSYLSMRSSPAIYDLLTVILMSNKVKISIKKNMKAPIKSN